MTLHTSTVAPPKRSKKKRLGLSIGTYVALWVLTWTLGSSQLRQLVTSGPSDKDVVSGNLKFEVLHVWAPCPFVLVGEKYVTGSNADPFAGSMSEQRILRCYAAWLGTPIELRFWRFEVLDFLYQTKTGSGVFRLAPIYHGNYEKTWRVP